MLRPTSFMVFMAIIGLAYSYKVDLYLGEQCRGADEGSIRPLDRNTCTDYDSQAGSAYLINNSDQDDNFELIFYDGDGCSGKVIAAAAGSGCITFDGEFASLSSRRTGSKRDATPFSAGWMSGVQTVNNIYRLNNVTVSDDDDDFDDGWLDLGLGRWIGIPENTSRLDWAQALDVQGFVSRPLTEDDLLDLQVDGNPNDGNAYSEMLPGTVMYNDTLSRRQFMGARCSRTVTCAFTVINAVESTYNRFAKIYDGLSDSRLWGVLNNGYVINIASHYYWTRTTNKLKASSCDKTDKQCLLDALADNFDEYPKQRIDTRNEELKNFQQGVTGHSEWQVRNQKPKKAMALRC